MFLPVVALAYDMFPPDWRGDEGTTYQEWRFDDNDNPALPENVDNEYGNGFDPPAIATITVGEYGEGWWDDPGLGSLTGMWDIGGTDGRIVLDIDNRPLQLEYKEIHVQITYYQSIGSAATVTVPTAQLVSSTTELVEEDIGSWAWYLHQSIWRIEPNPGYEQIILTGHPDGSLIDQIVVDTRCIPEPTSMALLALGGCVILRKRKQQA